MDGRQDEQNSWNAFVSGDDNAFQHIYNTYVKQLFNYGTHFSDDVELVKDCVQDLFIKLYFNRKQLTHVTNFKVYLFGALKNTLFNVFKKESNHYHIDTIEPVFLVESSHEDELIENEQLEEQKRRIAQTLEQLSPRQREILHYRFIEELSYDEICHLMRMNYQSVRNLLHRTIAKIRSGK